MTKIGQIYVPYNFAQICRIPPKIKFEILAHRGSQTTSPHARRLSRLLKPHAMGQMHFLASMTMDQDSQSLGGALRRATQQGAKLPKQRKARGKHGEAGKCAEEQDNKSTGSF